MITIVAKCQLKEGKKTEFFSSMKNLIDESRKEEGNIAYDLYEDKKNENTVAFIEKWKDEEAINLHNGSEHFKAGLKSIQDLSESVEICQYILVE